MARERLADQLGAVLALVGIGPRAAQDRPAREAGSPASIRSSAPRRRRRAPRASRRESRPAGRRRRRSPLRTTARMTALRPGQSPPPVSSPSRTSAILRKRAAGRVSRRMASTRPDRTRRGRSPLVSPPRALALSAIAAAAGAAAGIVLQLPPCARGRARPDVRELNEPLGGGRSRSRSADGTRLHAEGFGSDDGATVVLAHGWTERADALGTGHPDPPRARVCGRSPTTCAATVAAGRRAGERLLARALRRGRRGGARRMSPPRASWRPWSGTRWARCRSPPGRSDHESAARARAAAMVNTGLGDLITGHC